MDKIYDFVCDNKPVNEIVIVHSKAPDRADLLKQRLAEFVPQEAILIAELGASLGVHGGPGVLLAAVRKAGAI
jgi:fatty acid-binding protein DegV